MITCRHIQGTHLSSGNELYDSNLSEPSSTLLFSEIFGLHSEDCVYVFIKSNPQEAKQKYKNCEFLRWRKHLTDVHKGNSDDSTAKI